MMSNNDDFDADFLEQAKKVSESLGFTPYSGPNRQEEAKRASSTLAFKNQHNLVPFTSETAKQKGGRKPGTPNKVTRTFKMAAEKAFEKGGGVKWLVGMMNGTASDRAAVLALFGRLIPHQLQGEVNHSVKVELSWLGGRQIPGQVPYEQREKHIEDAHIIEVHNEEKHNEKKHND